MKLQNLKRKQLKTVSTLEQKFNSMILGEFGNQNQDTTKRNSVRLSGTFVKDMM